MNKKYQGTCLCGGVEFSVESFSEEAGNCHCTMCRKFHGAAFGTLVGVFGLTWINGEDLLKEFKAPNGTTRTFCSRCGSSLGFSSSGAGVEDFEVAIALFNEKIPVQVDAQIFTRYKASWCVLDKSLPVYEEGRGA